MSDWVGMRLWRWPRWAHYTLAISVSLLAILVRFYYREQFDGKSPFMISTLAVLIAAFAGGIRPGLAASAISLVFGVFLFVNPEQAELGWTGADRRSVAVAVVVWIAISYICDCLREVAMHNESLVTARDREQTQLAATLDSITDGFLAIDENWVVTRANSPMQEILGRDEPITGSPIWNVIDPLDSRELKEKIIEVREHAVSVRLDLPSRDGLRWYHLRLYPGDARGVVAFVQDITDRKQLEMNRDRMLAFERAARSSAEQASRLKDEFLATLSHELRTPLTTLLGWLELIEAREKLTGTVKEGFDAMQRSSHRLTKLIDELLDLSRINAGKIRLDFRHLKAADLVIEAVDVIQPLADEKGITLSVDIKDHDAVVRGDASRLHQVCANLLNNALKFTPTGGSVKISVQVVDEQVSIAVEDTGEGIPREFLPLIFERFRQADAKISRHHDGLGLGLAIVSQLVSLHGGSISADSPGLDQGSTFTIRLPLAESSTLEASAGDQALMTEPLLENLDGIEILLVDDDDGTREMLRIVLEDRGATVNPCESAELAIQSLEKQLPNIILSDIGMPEMDGYQFMTLVRKRYGDGNKLPAIALTAFARVEDRDLSLAVGFQAHLTRPVRAQDLVDEISRVLRRTAG